MASESAGRLSPLGGRRGTSGRRKFHSSGNPSWMGGGGGSGGRECLGGGGGGFIIGSAAGDVGSEEAYIFKYTLHDGVKAAGTDVFCLLVHLEGELGHLAQCLGSELEAYAFGLKQRGVLLGERGLGLGENAQEIVYGERLQLNANGEAALQFGDQVAGLGNMECAGGDEEDVVGADHAVARVDGGSFNDGEDIALNAFAGDVGAVATLAAGNLVDFIEEDDAVGFDAVDCGAIDSVHIDEAGFFFLDQVVECVADFHFAFL